MHLTISEMRLLQSSRQELPQEKQDHFKSCPLCRQRFRDPAGLASHIARQLAAIPADARAEAPVAHLAEDVLIEYFDGNLTGDALRQARQHLEECGACAARELIMRRAAVAAFGSNQSHPEDAVLLRYACDSESLSPLDRELLETHLFACTGECNESLEKWRMLMRVSPVLGPTLSVYREQQPGLLGVASILAPVRDIVASIPSGVRGRLDPRIVLTKHVLYHGSPAYLGAAPPAAAGGRWQEGIAANLELLAAELETTGESGRILAAALAYQAEGDSASAIRLLNQAVAAMPNAVEPEILLARLLDEANRADEASEHFNAAADKLVRLLQINPVEEPPESN